MPDQSPRAKTQGPRDQRKRPGDLTGVRGQQLAATRDNDRADQLAAATAVAVAEREEKRSTVVDYSQHGVIEEDVDLTAAPEEPHDEHMVIRVNFPIEDMTFGREVISPDEFDEDGKLVKAAVLGRLNTYNFEEGVQYKVPGELGQHLTRLGYVYSF
jgi:hypothetical protein